MEKIDEFRENIKVAMNYFSEQLTTAKYHSGDYSVNVEGNIFMLNVDEATYTVSIGIPDVCIYLANCNRELLKVAFEEVQEESLAIDDYDEIDYTYSSQMGDYFEFEGKTLIPLSIVISLTYFN